MYTTARIHTTDWFGGGVVLLTSSNNDVNSVF